MTRYRLPNNRFLVTHTEAGRTFRMEVEISLALADEHTIENQFQKMENRIRKDILDGSYAEIPGTEGQ